MIKSVSDLLGMDVLDPNGEKIGRVREVWADERTGEPAWASVDTGFLGIHHALVPLRDSVVVPAHLAVSVPKRVVEGAPRVSPVGDTMEDVEQRVLETHYRMDRSDT